MSFPTAAGLVSRVFDTDHAGNFLVMAGSGMLSGFALVEALPPAGRSDLAFLPIDAYPLEAVDGRFVLRPIEVNEPILAIKVTEPGQPAGLTGALDPGMRAFAIKVDASSGVSGFVYPGNFVDVYWTGNDGTREITRLIESSVNVIAIDQTTVGDTTVSASVAQTVTVQVSQEQVARLAQAQATGSLTLSLVGSGTETAANKIEVDSASLLGIVAEEVAEVEAEKVCTIRNRKGNEVVEIPIPCTN
jgi:pilus assembly protein CpaB